MRSSKSCVLITGCSSGIGRALALEYHRRGYRVFATARNLDALQDLATSGLETTRLDVNDADSIDKVLEKISQEAGRLDTLVNNAGYAAMGPLAELPLQALRRQFETNVIATMAMIQAFLPLLRSSDRAMVVQISSVSSVFVTPFAGAYCASKAAVHALTRALRMELAPFGIRMIEVQPGAIRSQFGSTAQNGLTATSPANTLYGPVRSAIEARAMASQANPTPAETLAHRLLDALEKPHPAALIRLGHGSRILPFMARWLPRPVLDRLLSKKFKLADFVPES